MQLCLDVGNSQIFGGVFEEKKLLLTFRYDTKQASSSDQLGLFMKSVLRENQIFPDQIKKIAFCSVVPALDYTVRSACIKYFDINPFILQANAKLGLEVKYNNPQEVGADRIANAVAGISLFPNQPLIIVDFGTATTCCAVNSRKQYLGGAILPGLRLSMEALQYNTAKLFPVEIIQPNIDIGKTTTESLQMGLYYMQLGAIKELITCFRNKLFSNEEVVTLGTGGFAHLFSNQQLFTKIVPDLVLHGLQIASALNPL